MKGDGDAQPKIVGSRHFFFMTFVAYLGPLFLFSSDIGFIFPSHRVLGEIISSQIEG